MLRNELLNSGEGEELPQLTVNQHHDLQKQQQKAQKEKQLILQKHINVL